MDDARLADRVPDPHLEQHVDERARLEVVAADLTVADYEAIRSETTRFLVRAGHESPEFEDVLERIDGCLVVEDRAFERLREAS
jgi:hypothetical protein